MPPEQPDHASNTESTIHQHISVTLREAVGSASISPSGRDVCLAARKGLFIVDLDDPWQQPRLLPYASAIVADVQWSPHPSRAHWVVSTSGNKGLVWNLAASSASPIEHTCLGHERAITDMNWAVFQVDTLATCGIDGNVFVYDLRSGGSRPASRYSGWRYGAAQVKYNRQNPNELASSHGEYLYIWDDRKGSLPVTKIRAHEQKIYGIDYSRKASDKIVTCSLDSTVKYWTLDGSPTIDEPTQVLQTSSPVWRARHTPFGDGLVTLPQRSDYEVKIWAQHSPEKEVYNLNSHRDVVREFLWRTQGGNDPGDDDRVFQLVTWSNDNQLLLTPISSAVCADLGHLPHSPIEVRHLRRNAENRSYRDVLPSPLAIAAMAGAGVSPTAHLGASADSASGRSDGMISKMTPPTLLNNASRPSARIALSATSRYRRSGNSAHSASSAGASPIFGTSPADAKGLSLFDRRSLHTSAVQQPHRMTPEGDSAARTQPKAPAFMTRAGARQPGKQDAVDWMENVRIVSKGTNDTAVADGVTMEEGMLALAEGVSSIGERDIVPLHEELTAMARAFESKVRFEKISVPLRSVIAATYGPWARSGLPTLIRMTFEFPLLYPSEPVTIDIGRSSHIGNKARAKLLSGVRSLAERYALKKRNSLEACLICLIRGEIIEPDDTDEDDLDNFGGKHLLIGGLAEDDAEDGSDDERTLANRNCPPPRRCGAVFAPNGLLFAFYPLDSLHQRGASEKRPRSLSPAAERHERQRRRRLFESFGVIPSLQLRSNPTPKNEIMEDVQEEDSDEALNIPSLLMTGRRQSRGGTASVDGTSQYTRVRLAGPSHSFNSRLYVHRLASDSGLDTTLSHDYNLNGDLRTIIRTNASLVAKSEASVATKRTWATLRQLVCAFATTETSNHSAPFMIGEGLAEKLCMDMLDIFFRLGDIQMLGILACLVELDRRNLNAAKSPPNPSSVRSPDSAAPLDYFSLKPLRPTASLRHSQTSTRDGQRSLTPSGIPLKSPTTWLMSTSYGTQNSSAGSKGSSWANNLSTFFKSNSTMSAGKGISTPPVAPVSDGAQHGSLSPAFTKRSSAGLSTEAKRTGGIASGRPNNAKTRTTTHVSFATHDKMTMNVPLQIKPNSRSTRIIVRRLDVSEPVGHRSLLLRAHVQHQLEYYRLLYAELLLRLRLPHQRARVLKLTRSAVDGSNTSTIRKSCGIEDDAEKGVCLEVPCETCKHPLSGQSPAYCVPCKRRRKALPCALCHLPLNGLTETCLVCLHTCHLGCLQEWRQEEDSCPASCGCQCAISSFSLAQKELLAT